MIAFLLVMGGCSSSSRDGLVIATDWPRADCQRLASDLGAKGIDWIDWLRLAPGDDPTRLVRSGSRIDVVLGGPVASHRRLADAGLLAKDGGWRVARRSPLGATVDRRARERRGLPAITTTNLAEPALGGLIALDDSRRDPAALAWSRARLNQGDWAGGYAELVRLAGLARRAGAIGGSARAVVARGTAILAVGTTPAVGFDFVPIGERIECVSVPASARNVQQARAVLEQFERAPTSPEPIDDLLGELLGATLVDAQDELWSAREALARAGGVPRLSAWMTQAPPWPPASVEKLKSRANAETLIETLAEQVAPEPTARAWLRESWRGPSRPIDGPTLAALAEADGGRLAAHPHFRAWLRAEWTAWARQRYRRVARQVEAEARRS